MKNINIIFITFFAAITFNLTQVTFSQDIYPPEIESFLSQLNQYDKPAIYKERKLPTKPEQTILKSTDDPKHICVKFLDHLNITINSEGYPIDKSNQALKSEAATLLLKTIAQSGGEWFRMAGASEADMDDFRIEAERNLNREVANLNNYIILKVPEHIKSELWIDQLNLLSEVEIAQPLPLPVPPPIPPNFFSRQGYLDTALVGIGATYAWSLGEIGTNVTICDFEYSWNLSHQDLPPGIQVLLPTGYTASDPYFNNNHGTAVLGELASLNNGWGTTGAAYGATIKVAPTYLNNTWLIGTAMTHAMTFLTRGDIFLIEHQIGGPLYQGIPNNDTGLVPIEWYQPWYDVIITAVGNGIHVVEAGGNGYQDLDNPIYSTGNFGHWPFLNINNSGAIIVGAGAVPSSFYGTDVPRSRLAFSNYGSRLDLQGWGEMVVTTGYGRLYSAEGVNLWYDSLFAGTSSASPIVASAVALMESRFEALYSGRTISPIAMRSILVNTGTPQQSGTFPSSQKIGLMPDLKKAMNFSAHLFTGGVYPIGTSSTYKNITDVVNILKNKIITGNLIFELQSDYNGTTGESFPIVFNEFTTIGGDWTVTIRPASSVILQITQGDPGPNLPLIEFNGADRIIFDGRPGGTGAISEWLIRNSRNNSAGPTFQFSNGANDNKLTYLQIEGKDTLTSRGTIYFQTKWGSSGNDRNIISNNMISDRSDITGLPANAIYCDWVQPIVNDSNIIMHNEIFDWNNAGVVLCGERWQVNANSFFQTQPSVTNLTSISILNGNGHILSGNYIGGSSPSALGAPWVNTMPTIFSGIFLSVDTLVPTSVQGNIIKNIMYTNPGPSNFWGISLQQGNADIGTIQGNIIGDLVTTGSISYTGTGVMGPIAVSSNGKVKIENNLIANIEQNGLNPGEVRVIYAIGNEITILGNRIYSVGPNKPGAMNLVRGIYLDQFIDSVIIANNMITLGGTLTDNCTYDGIHDNIQTGKMITQIFFNSIYIGSTASGPNNSYCYRRIGPSMIDIKNNIFYNNRVGPGLHYAIANIVHPVGWFIGSSDYNILNNQVSTNLTHWIGTDMNLSTWQLPPPTGTGCDANSINADPKFLNSSIGDLHINPAVYSPADNSGVSISIVSNDFDGNVRGLNPDIGADEYTINIPGAFTLISPSNTATNQPLSGTLVWHPSAAAGRYDVVLDTISPPTTFVSTNQTDTTFAYSGLDSNKTYYWSAIAKNSSGNIAATGSPWRFSTLSSGTGIISDETFIPTSYSLEQNYPNPFNSSTKIRFDLPEQSDVILEIYDLLGQKIITIVNETLPAGRYNINFEARELTSGVYYYRIKTGKFVQIKQLLLIK